MKFNKIKGYGLGMDCDSNSTKQQVIENKVLIIKNSGVIWYQI